MRLAPRILDIAGLWKGGRGPAVAVVALVLLAGCAGLAPYQHMSDARQAIASAEAVIDDDPGPAAVLAAARDRLERAGDYLQAGEYERARLTADEARRLAIDAREAATDKSRSAPGSSLDR